MKNNVIKLENYQAAEEKNISVTLEEVIHESLLKSQNILEFGPIPKNATGDDWDYDDAEFYIVDDGEALMGTRFTVHMNFKKKTLMSMLIWRRRFS